MYSKAASDMPHTSLFELAELPPRARPRTERARRTLFSVPSHAAGQRADGAKAASHRAGIQGVAESQPHDGAAALGALARLQPHHHGLVGERYTMPLWLNC